MDGILVVNKPKGITSFDVVYKVRKVFNEKVGHTGTLDPLAHGVLQILIGKATKCSKYLINHDKEYVVILKLGIKTDTLDEEGKILKEEKVDKKILEKEYIEKILNKNTGIQMQTPPIYSAIKVNGKKLYEYARKGEEVEIKPRPINIYELKLLEINKDENIIKLNVKCSKGTYIRSLCEKIAEELGTIGYMHDLLRTKAGSFSINQSVNIEEIEEILESSSNKEKVLENLKSKVITIEDIFCNLNNININEIELSKFLNGVSLKKNEDDGLYKIYCNKFIGLGIIKDSKLKRDIII